MSNQADCIKAACDFVLPWGLHQCLKLANEFRAENLVDDPWMMDVVQTKLTALHAYMNVRSQLASMEAMEVDRFSANGDLAGNTTNLMPPSFSIEDTLHPEPLSPESLPDNSVLDMEQDQQKQQRDIGALDKSERNKRNRELKKASRRTKQSQKTLEPFICPWCSTHGSCSISILKHMYVFHKHLFSRFTFLTKGCSSERLHSFKTVLNKSQMKQLKRAHQNELCQRLRCLSISECAPVGSGFRHNWDS